MHRGVAFIRIRSEKWRTPVFFCQCFICLCVCLCVCAHMCTYMCMLVSVFLTCGQQVFCRLDSLSVGSRDFSIRGWPSWPIFAGIFCHFPTLCFPTPIRHVNGSYHLLLSSAKKKETLLASLLISACHLMRSLLFIFLFVRREGGKHK